MDCFYCNREMADKGRLNWRGITPRNSRTTDHIVPVSKFHAGHPSNRNWHAINRVEVCFACNNRKGDMWPLDWLTVMPEQGVQRLAERLVKLGCEQELVDMAIGARPKLIWIIK